MNKQEAIEKLNKEYNDFLSSLQPDGPFLEGYISASIIAKSIINQIDEPQKYKVPQVAVEFYERYKDDNLSLEEWFGDFYSSKAIEDFPKIDELAKWLYDNDDETNRQHEFALATLVTLGINAVEVEKEPLYTVEIPDPYGKYKHTVLYKHAGNVSINRTDDEGWKVTYNYQLTEEEIKRNHEWAWQWAKPVEKVCDKYDGF